LIEPKEGSALRSGETDSFQTSRVLTITGAHAVHDTYTAFLPPLLPAFVSKFALSNTEAGALTVFLQASSFLQPYIGYLADRVSLRYFVILGPATAAVTMSLLGIAPGYALLALLLTIVGLSSSVFHSVAPVVAGRLSGSNLGRGMGLWMVGGELGRTLGPVIIVTAVNLLTLEGTAWLAIAGLVASLLLYVLLRDLPARPPTGPEPISFRDGLRALKPLMIPLVGVTSARVFMLAALTTYLPIFLTEEGADLWVAGAALTVLEAAGVLGALAGGSLSDRVGRRFVMSAAMVSTPVFMFLFLATSGWLRLPLLLVLGFTSLSVAPVIMAVVQESAPENRSMANGLYMALSFGIRAVAVLALGAAGDMFGLRVAFAASAVAPLLGLPFVALLPRGTA
jgi:FSR family fosmidomycin resistance protein-like MFS transporter